ncbi:hypothetical protein QE152_g15619 [Popillia japonica]|uniref:Uncharacterized protein n=1 Tax=Popillia japonica TaxID=7064 RepID=A0AAW1L7G7_POPJA
MPTASAPLGDHNSKFTLSDDECKSDQEADDEAAEEVHDLDATLNPAAYLTSLTYLDNNVLENGAYDAAG